jgi:hypothetical protein
MYGQMNVINFVAIIKKPPFAAKGGFFMIGYGIGISI